MKVYTPSVINHKNTIPIIMYPLEGVEKFANSRVELEKRVISLTPNNIPLTSSFALCFPSPDVQELILNYDIYSNINNSNWKNGNPNISNISIRLTRDPYGNLSACGISRIISGKEEEYRRTTLNLKEYINSRPNIPCEYMSNYEFI